jgi:hypothetical protein
MWLFDIWQDASETVNARRKNRTQNGEFIRSYNNKYGVDVPVEGATRYNLAMWDLLKTGKSEILQGTADYLARRKLGATQDEISAALEANPSFLKTAISATKRLFEQDGRIFTVGDLDDLVQSIPWDAAGKFTAAGLEITELKRKVYDKLFSNGADGMVEYFGRPKEISELNQLYSEMKSDVRRDSFANSGQ